MVVFLPTVAVVFLPCVSAAHSHIAVGVAIPSYESRDPMYVGRDPVSRGPVLPNWRDRKATLGVSGEIVNCWSENDQSARVAQS